jgi:hypothetical protein
MRAGATGGAVNPRERIGGNILNGIRLTFTNPTLRGIAILIICYTTVSTVLYVEQADTVAKTFSNSGERTAFALRRKRRQSPAWRIDDAASPPLRNVRVERASPHRPPEVSLGQRLPARVGLAAPLGYALVVFRLREPGLLRVAAASARSPAAAGHVAEQKRRQPSSGVTIGAAFERNTRGLHHVERRLDIGLAPRSSRVLPTARSLDEMIGLARRAANGIANLRVRRAEKRCSRSSDQDASACRRSGHVGAV